MKRNFTSTLGYLWAAMLLGPAASTGCELIEDEQEIEFRTDRSHRPAPPKREPDEGESSGDSGVLGETEGWPPEPGLPIKPACVPLSDSLRVIWLPNDDEVPSPPRPPTETPPAPCPLPPRR